MDRRGFLKNTSAFGIGTLLFPNMTFVEKIPDYIKLTVMPGCIVSFTTKDKPNELQTQVLMVQTWQMTLNEFRRKHTHHTLLVYDTGTNGRIRARALDKKIYDIHKIQCNKDIVYKK